MKEIWKPINGFVGVYEVSNLGRVKSFKKGEGLILSLRKHHNHNYVSVSVLLYGNNRTNHKLVSRLVAQAFISNPENRPCVNHIDNNPSNNKVNNLEWCTHLENTQHANRQGRLKVPRIGCRGKNNYGGITKEKVLEIRKLWLSDKKTQKEIASIYKVSKLTINKIINKKAWGYV